MTTLSTSLAELQAAPYYDDFEKEKGYYRILFRPGTAVQARELTQLQTQIKNQIEQFGDHIFQHGSVVVPGNSFSDLGVPFVKINGFTNLSTDLNKKSLSITDFEGKTVIGETSGIKAIVKKALPKEDDDPIIFYLSYLNGGTDEDGNSIVEFLAGETLKLVEYPNYLANVYPDENTYKGLGSLTSINNGIYYVKGFFVYVESQTIVIEKYSDQPSCHVLLEINESIVDFLDDESLLDPAGGFSNYSAPGADRLKIELKLISKPFESGTSFIDSDYIEIMRYENGVLQEHMTHARYSELDKYFARRTYDESGNYIVNGLNTRVKNHLKEANKDGVYVDGDDDKMVLEIDPGKAYVKGYEVNNIGRDLIELDKARGEDHIASTEIVLTQNYGNYILVHGFDTKSISLGTVITFYTFADDTTVIGTAKVLGIDYYVGSFDGEDDQIIYKLWLTNIAINAGHTFDEVGHIKYGGGGTANAIIEYLISKTGTYDNFDLDDVINVDTAGTRSATVVYHNSSIRKCYAYRHSAALPPRRNDIFHSGADDTFKEARVISEKRFFLNSNASDGISLLFNLQKEYPFSLRNPVTRAYTNLSYTVQKEYAMALTEDTAGVSSDIVGIINAGAGETFLPIETGTFLAFKDGEYVSPTLFAISVNANKITFNGDPSDYAAGNTLKIFTAVRKDEVEPKTKEVVTITQQWGFDEDNIWNPIELNHVDVIRLVSVVDSVRGDISDEFILSGGQTDFLYQKGSIRKIPNTPALERNLAITYKYFSHSGNGDFFCIDSYENVDHDEPGIMYTSPATNKTYNLLKCIDFRPKIEDNIESAIISGSVFYSDLQYYIPRIDALTLSSLGKFKLLSGVPNEFPKPPSIASDLYLLDLLYIPPYTTDASDVIIKRSAVVRYEMKDIKELSDRIDRIEDFGTMTADEQDTLNYDIIDAETGLSRVKTGFIVENFNEPHYFARTTHPDFSVSFVGGNMHPRLEKLSCELLFREDDSSGYKISGNRFFVDYTEKVFAEQPLSSRITNLNPFLVISWDGILTVDPPSMFWAETRYLPMTVSRYSITVDNPATWVPSPRADAIPGSWIWWRT